MKQQSFWRSRWWSLYEGETRNWQLTIHWNRWYLGLTWPRHGYADLQIGPFNLFYHDKLEF